MVVFYDNRLTSPIESRAEAYGGYHIILYCLMNGDESYKKKIFCSTKLATVTMSYIDDSNVKGFM